MTVTRANSPESVKAALLLTNRLVEVGAKPLTASQFWRLLAVSDPADLAALDPGAIAEAAGVDDSEAIRFRTLLDASRAMAFEQERLQEGGITLLSALDERFPNHLRTRLGANCPPFLLVAGPLGWLDTQGLGVVGSRNATDDAMDAARQSGRVAVEAGWSVVSGLARGVDQAAMASALEAGGKVLGFPAEGLSVVSRKSEVRNRVHRGELCLASPYAPSARFRPGNAMGRNKLIYAASRVTVVVASEAGAGGTWAGADEALRRGYGSVAALHGNGFGSGNAVLTGRGATPITTLSQLLDVGPIETASAPNGPAPEPMHQAALF